MFPKANNTTLAPEIISEVASYVVSDAQDTATRDRVPLFEWIGITQVCQLWRNTVARHATLWKEIVVTGLDALTMSLTRSRRMPLTISGSIHAEERRAGLMGELAGLREESDKTVAWSRSKGKKGRNVVRFQRLEQLDAWAADIQRQLDLEKEQDIQMLARIRQHLWHLPSLTLRAPSRVLKRLSSPLRTPAPVLEELDIDRTDRRGTADLSRLASPQLRRLRLYNFHVDEFKMILSRSLETLDISGMGIIEPTGNMVDLLSYAPNLQQLRLSVELVSTPGNMHLVRRVKLPALRRLELGMCGAGDAELLCLVSTPNLEEARLNITCTDELEDLMKLLGRQLTRLKVEDCELRGCTIYVANSQSIHLMLTPQATAIDIRSFNRGIHISFDLFDRREEHIIINLISQYFTAIFGPVRCLSVQDGIASTEEAIIAWRRLYQLLPQVTRLHMKGSATSTLPTGLVYRHLTNPLRPWPSLFPNLNLLELESVWFRFSSRRAAQDEGDFIDRLIRPYERGGDRETKDLTLSYPSIVIIAGINIFKHDIEPLEQIFGDVVWDGYEEEMLKNNVHEEGVDSDSEDGDGDDEDDELEDGEYPGDRDSEEDGFADDERDVPMELE